MFSLHLMWCSFFCQRVKSKILPRNIGMMDIEWFSFGIEMIFIWCVVARRHRDGGLGFLVGSWDYFLFVFISKIFFHFLLWLGSSCLFFTLFFIFIKIAISQNQYITWIEQLTKIAISTKNKPKAPLQPRYQHHLNQKRDQHNKDLYQNSQSPGISISGVRISTKIIWTEFSTQTAKIEISVLTEPKSRKSNLDQNRNITINLTQIKKKPKISINFAILLHQHTKTITSIAEAAISLFPETKSPSKSSKHYHHITHNLNKNRENRDNTRNEIKMQCLPNSHKPRYHYKLNQQHQNHENCDIRILDWNFQQNRDHLD